MKPAVFSFQAALVSALFVFPACSKAGEALAQDPLSAQELEDVARGIHERVITLDTHNDFRLSNFTPEQNYTMELDSQVNLPKMEAGGLDVSWLIVYTGQGELTEEGYGKAHEHGLEMFAAIHRLVQEYAPEQMELALTSEDVRRIHAAGKKVVMIGVENAYPVGLDLENIKRFHDLGGRYMSLAHNGHSQFSDSNTGEKDDVWLHGGLSELGRQAIAEMNRWGVMIDVSHPSKEAIMQMLGLSRAPLIASHSSARALNDVSRNLDDEQLLALKENGAVVQAVAFRSYLNSEKHAANRDAINAVHAQLADELGFERLDRQALRDLDEADRADYATRLRAFQEAAKLELAEAERQAPPVDVADFVDHIDYLVALIGIEHVGISSDFDGGGGVEGWKDASETFNVTLELVRRGYSEEDIGLLWSGNLLRVLDEVQLIAAQIQTEAR